MPCIGNVLCPGCAVSRDPSRIALTLGPTAPGQLAVENGVRDGRRVDVRGPGPHDMCVRLSTDDSVCKFCQGSGSEARKATNAMTRTAMISLKIGISPPPPINGSLKAKTRSARDEARPDPADR